MNRWFDTKDAGLVNGQFVKRVRRLKDGSKHLIDHQDRVLGELWSNFDETDLTSVVIPAITPMMALIVTWVKPCEEEPTGVWSEERLIIAWRIHPDSDPHPIIAGCQPASNQDALIIHQDGTCEEQFMCTHKSREEAIESIRKEERWKKS